MLAYLNRFKAKACSVLCSLPFLSIAWLGRAVIVSVLFTFEAELINSDLARTTEIEILSIKFQSEINEFAYLTVNLSEAL